VADKEAADKRATEEATVKEAVDKETANKRAMEEATMKEAADKRAIDKIAVKEAMVKEAVDKEAADKRTVEEDTTKEAAGGAGMGSSASGQAPSSMVGTKRVVTPSGSTPPAKRAYRGIWKPQFVQFFCNLLFSPRSKVQF
jgi:membrane protein involved in colicin uptake